jgi:hypothetical protein
MSLYNLYQGCSKISHTRTHTHTPTHACTHTHSSSCFIVTLSLIGRTACAHAQFSRCSSITNVHGETGQMAFCCQVLPLGAVSTHSALSELVGVLFKNFSLFLNKPWTSLETSGSIALLPLHIFMVCTCTLFPLSKHPYTPHVFQWCTDVIPRPIHSIT